jgi:hypothetical protein
MNSYDRRQDRLAREQRTDGFENQRRAQVINAKKQTRKIDMANVRATTVKTLHDLIHELEPVRSGILLDASAQILSSSRAPYGMIIALEGCLRANQVNTEKSPWKERLDALKKEVSMLTDPNKYYFE